MIHAAAIALVLGTSVVAAWVPGEHSEPTITFAVENWGESIVLGEPGAVAFAHLGANGPATRVTVTIDPGRDGMHGYSGRLTAPDAFGGELLLYCGDEYRRIESPVVCGFDVPMTRGANRLVFDLQSTSFGGIRSAEAVVLGGALEQITLLEVRHPDGSWDAASAGEVMRMPGAASSAVRYRILNTGEVPFRATTSCQPDGTVWPGQQLVCPLRGARPVYALAGPYAVAVRLEDPVGGGASYRLTMHIVPDALGSRVRGKMDG